jgi:hypothetical protein
MDAYLFIEQMKQIAARWDREAIAQDSIWCRRQAENHRFYATRVAISLETLESETASKFEKQSAIGQLNAFNLSYKQEVAS